MFEFVENILLHLDPQKHQPLMLWPDGHVDNFVVYYS